MTKTADRRDIPSAEDGVAAIRGVAEKPLVYASPAILERRRRILEETRRLVAEQGLAGFNMGELCKRAGVAKRTLYNAFQTKEQMIAVAISEYFEDYVDRIAYMSPLDSLERNVERLIAVSRRNLEIRNYISAIMSIFFSPGVNPDIWETMQSMAARPTRRWLEAVGARGELQPWIDAGRFAGDIVRFEYATINEWAQGHMANAELTSRLVLGFLTLASGATQGPARAEIEALSERISAKGVQNLFPARRRRPSGAETAAP